MKPLQNETEIVEEFKDAASNVRQRHKTKFGIRTKRQQSTVVQTYTNVAGSLIGRRIRELRIARNMTMEALCLKSGIVSTHPKNRMAEIENSVRCGGVKLGTLYAIARALGVSIVDLMPSVEAVAALSDVKQVPSLTTVRHMPGDKTRRSRPK